MLDNNNSKRRPAAIATCIGMAIITAAVIVVVYASSKGGGGGGSESSSPTPATVPGSVAAPTASSLPLLSVMEFIIPLYTPPYQDSVLYGQWELLKNTAVAGTAVVGIMNPASGPGTVTDPGYITAINDVKGSGAQLICYVATSYGAKSAEDVEADVQAYHALYPGACDGIFFDETPHVLDTYAPQYRSYNRVAHSRFDTTAEQTRVVFNPGQDADERYFEFSPPAGIVGYENYYYTMDAGVPSTATGSQGSNVFLVHSAYELAQNHDLIYDLVREAFCKGWSPIYVTDDVMPNPWDVPPTFWDILLNAAKDVPVSC